MDQIRNRSRILSLFRQIRNRHDPIKWNTHEPPIFSKLSILTVFGINELQTACFMHKVMNNLVPLFFVNMFTVNSAIHNYNTRKKNNVHVPSYRIKVREHSVSVCGVKM